MGQVALGRLCDPPPPLGFGLTTHGSKMLPAQTKNTEAMHIPEAAGMPQGWVGGMGPSGTAVNADTATCFERSMCAGAEGKARDSTGEKEQCSHLSGVSRDHAEAV